MPDQAGRDRDFVLAPNEVLFVQDQTSGQIQVYVGPLNGQLQPQNKPLTYDPKNESFATTDGDIRRAVQKFIMADERSYIVLENPTVDDAKNAHPEVGRSQAFTVELTKGRKINIPGPGSFALWPGQVANVIPGHQLRTNQYLVVRVYNEEAARESWADQIIAPAESAPSSSEVQEPHGDAEADSDELSSGTSEATPSVTPSMAKDAPKLSMGQLLIIKGTEVSFYIPPTGVEVVPEQGGKYVREAVTLERLQYCILFDEDGNKRYVRGPDVVFPEPTETFMTGADGSSKFRAIDLNDDMGLYIKVTADYAEGGKTHKAGDELFITGKEQKLYFPRAEHSLIQYGEREIQYGVAVPKGEARYVLEKPTGKVELEKGPQIFLGDPRKQVIVRRVLTEDEVSLWFPGSKRAADHNQRLRALQERGDDILEDYEVRRALGSSRERAHRRMQDESAVEAYGGDTMDRGTRFTEPRTITLDTKFDGAVALNIWNGYAVMVVDKEGNHRVEIGPKTVLLEYDETLQVLELSTGKPKNTDRLERTVYLRVRYNQVSDIVEVMTKDMVRATVKLSWRVNFVDEKSAERWFAVENYVKALCDHTRSMLRHAAKQFTVEEFYADYIAIIRDTILGKPGGEDNKRPLQRFGENNLEIYDVEVSACELGDHHIQQLLVNSQIAEVERTLNVTSAERGLAAEMRLQEIERASADERAKTGEHQSKLEQKSVQNALDVSLATSEAQKQRDEKDAELREARQKVEDLIAEALRVRKLADSDLELGISEKEQSQRLVELKAEAAAVVEKMKAIDPKLIAALEKFGDLETVRQLMKAVSPLALIGGESLTDIAAKLFKGTGAASLIEAVGKKIASDDDEDRGDPDRRDPDRF